MPPSDSGVLKENMHSSLNTFSFLWGTLRPAAFISALTNSITASIYVYREIELQELEVRDLTNLDLNFVASESGLHIALI